MSHALHDRRLQQLTDQRCGLCNRPDATATGRAERLQSGRWKLEVRCDRCGETSLVPAPDHPLVRTILRDPAVPEPVAPASPTPTLPPVPVLTTPPLLHVHETASLLARNMRRAFALTVREDGALHHEDVAISSKFGSLQIRHTARVPAVLDQLGSLLHAAGRDRLPEQIGRGEHHAVLTTPRAPHPVTVRWTQRGRTRHFDGAPGITAAVVGLVDGLVTLLDWLDAGALDPLWPGDGEPQQFPHPGDLLSATPAIYLGKSDARSPQERPRDTHELWISATGDLEQHSTHRDGVRHIRTATLEPAATARLFAALAALDPASFRRHIGHVHRECRLMYSHQRTLAWFDGARVHYTSLVYGSEHMYPATPGDVPPTPAELAAFALLNAARLPRRPSPAPRDTSTRPPRRR
jgi:hypothetical protein